MAPRRSMRATSTLDRDSGIEGRDSVGMYLDEIARTPLLDAATEVELSKAIEAGLLAQHLLDIMVAMKAEDLQAVTAKIEDIVGYECRRMSALQFTDTTATVLLEGDEELGPETRAEMVEDIASWLQVYHFPRLEVEIKAAQG